MTASISVRLYVNNGVKAFGYIEGISLPGKKSRKKCVTKLSFARDRLSVADHLLLISRLRFYSVCALQSILCRHALERAQAQAVNFTFVSEGKKEKPKRNECAISRTKKRIIKNFSSADSEKARTRSFARVDPSSAPGTNHTALGSQKRGSIRSRERSAVYRLVALYLRSALTTKARPFQSSDRQSRDPRRGPRGYSGSCLIVIYGKNPTETQSSSDDSASIIRSRSKVAT